MDYYSILRRSWQIVKKNKTLWIFGMTLAAISAGSSYSSNSSSFNRGIKDSPQNIEKTRKVLGAAIQNPQAVFSSIFHAIPISFWVILVISFILLIGISLVLRIFISSWASSALISLSSRATKNEQINLEKGTADGLSHWKQFLYIGFVIWGGYLSVALVLALVLLIGIFSSKAMPIFGAISIVFAIFLVIGGIISIFFVILWELFAKLVTAIEGYSMKNSLRFSWQITKNFFWNGILLGIINAGVGCVVGIGIGLFFAMLIAALFIGTAINKDLGGVIFLILLIPTITFFLSLVLVGGIQHAFTTCNWVIFYEDIKKSDQFPKSLNQNGT